MRNKEVLKIMKKKGSIVVAEIGVARGKHALMLLSDLPNVKKIYLIDPYCNYDIINNKAYVINKKKKGHGVLTKDDALECRKEALHRLSRYSDKIEWVYDFSEKAAEKIKNKKLDMVYIDGNHRYEYVKKDVELYCDKVKAGGVVAGHDFSDKNVEKAIVEFCSEREYSLHLYDADEWYFIK